MELYLYQRSSACTRPDGDPLLYEAAPAVDMLGAQAPALIGTWMGARIIASYMKKHKDMKLKDLLEFTDYHVMLSESNYLAS